MVRARVRHRPLGRQPKRFGIISRHNQSRFISRLADGFP
jgi:hypothetical protein